MDAEADIPEPSPAEPSPDIPEPSPDIPEPDAPEPDIPVEPTPKKRGPGRPPKSEAKVKPTPKAKPVPKAKPAPKKPAPPPAPRPSPRQPMIEPPDDPLSRLSSHELIAELLVRRQASDRARQRDMYRSWLLS